MRTPPRKLRPFRPSPLALEAICPVSSLATALPMAGWAVAGKAGTPVTQRDRPGHHASAGTPSVASPRMAPRAVRSPVGFGSVTTAPRISLPPAPPAAPAFAVDLARFANAITIASANAPLARPGSGAAPNPDTGGGGGIAPAAQPSSGPAVAPASSGVASPPPVLAVTPPVSPPSPAGIRPMTLAATRAATPASTSPGTATTFDMTMSGSSSGSDTGSPIGSPVGSPVGSTSGSVKNSASIHFSGGGYVYNPGDGSYTDIIGHGLNAVDSVIGPDQLQSVTWTVTGAGFVISQQTFTLTAGSNTLFNGPVTDPVPAGQTDDNIHFFWGPTKGDYVIKSVATFANYTVPSQVTVHVVAPTLNNLQMNELPLKAGIFNERGVDSDGFSQGEVDGTPAGDTVQASVTMPNIPDLTGGRFGFIQMLKGTLSVTGNISGLHQKNMTDFVLDDSGSSGSWFQNTWTSDYYPSQGQTADIPQIAQAGAVPPVYDSPASGAPASWSGDPTRDYYTSINYQQEFKTYLMFIPNNIGMPGSAAWVPIGAVSWNFVGASKFDPMAGHHVFDDTVPRQPSDTGTISTGGPNQDNVAWAKNYHQVPWSPPFPMP